MLPCAALVPGHLTQMTQMTKFESCGVPSEGLRLKHFVEIGDGFFHLRAPFWRKFFLNIGTHMALCRTTSGRFLVLDTVKLSPGQKADIDLLTDNGNLIDAVIGTHPYHTLFFRDFYSMYPNAQYFGTPRHVRNFPDIPWAKNSINDPETLKKWEPDVSMRIPSGSEFDNPQPEDTNHFSNVVVFHRKSKTVFNDDTLIYFNLSPLNPIRLAAPTGLRFHPSLTTVGLYPTKEAPQQFKQWMKDLLNDWQFANLCTAHNDNIIGHAHEKVSHLLQKVDKTLDDLSKKYENDKS